MSSSPDHTNVTNQWSRAVWFEKDKEMEHVVPSSWISEECIFWPPMNAKKNLYGQKPPGPKWLQFPLKKIKISSGIKEMYLYLLW